MNTNKLSLLKPLLFAVVAGTAPLAKAEIQNPATVASDSFDFDKINASLTTALSTFSATNDAIDSLMYQLDPIGTDVANDRYLFDVSLQLSRTPWSDDQLKAEGTFGISTDLQDPNEPGLNFSVKAVFQTDALAMLKYKITKISHCDAPEKSAGIMGILWRRHCEYVARLPQIETVSDLHDLLAEKIAVHQSDVRAYIASLNEALSQMAEQKSGNTEIEKLLQAQIKASDGALTFLNGIILTESKYGFTLEAPAFSGCPILGSSGMSLAVSPTTLAIKGAVHLNFGKSLYAAAKPVVVEVLHGLERGDEVAMKLVQLDAEIFANMIQNVLPGSDEMTN
jgi:hypothetical protein